MDSSVKRNIKFKRKEGRKEDKERKEGKKIQAPNIKEIFDIKKTSK